MIGEEPKINGTHGNKIIISVYVDGETFDKIEKVRGRIPRSAFVSDILSEVMEEA